VDERRLKFYVNIDKDVPHTLIGDDQRLAQAITNLLSNAVKFTPEEGAIHLDSCLIWSEGDMCRLQISVEDTGIGITDEQKSRLFNSFEQAEAGTTRKYGGTGLGLSISKNIVKLMGGDIWVDSEPGKGSDFIFTVILKKDQSDVKNQLPEYIDNFSENTILLADDVEINREIVMALLEPTGVNITCAENGTQAVQMFCEEPEKYDMIFMDIQMPEMDGYEAAKAIRKSGIARAREIPIVAMTANVFKEDIEKCFEAGMDDHIGKPLNFDDVLKRLRIYLKI
jgi:CheY-like chemotaxis protein